MIPGKKIYFASDFHLGVPNREKSLEREKRIVAWLDMIKKDASELFLMGDVFDMWFEYSMVVPRGYVRLLGKLAELSDSGIRIHYFTGNHDMWVFDYLPQEIGLTIYRKPITREWNGKKFYLGHGDGLGPGDHGYKFIKKIFASRFCQWLFARLHPNFALRVANYFSRRSRISTGDKDSRFLGNEKEWLVIYAREILKKEKFDYFVFGHRHLPLEIELADGVKYFNLGEWVNYKTYAVFDGVEMRLERFQ